MKFFYFPFLVLLAVISGCHEVMEYQSNDQSRLTFIRTSDYEVEGYIDGLSEGRVLMSYGSDELILLSSDGTLHRIDTEAMIVDTSYNIGGSSGAGYSDAVIARNGNLYVLGPGSQVIEVNLALNKVVDQFTPGSKPGSLCASPTLDRLYFTDSVAEYIGEIWTSSNYTGFTSDTYFPMADVMVEQTGGRHIVAVSSDDFGTIFGIWLDLSNTARRLTSVSAGSPCSNVIPLNRDSVYAISCPDWTAANGYVYFVQGYIDPQLSVSLDVEGHPTEMCYNPNIGYAGNLCILGRTDSGNTAVTIVEFPYSFIDPAVTAVIDIDGFPRDIIAPANGKYLLVLTSD